VLYGMRAELDDRGTAGNVDVTGGRAGLLKGNATPPVLQWNVVPPILSRSPASASCPGSQACQCHS
jgi:hypothetical protein